MADILYFDGQCPLCKREMAKLASVKDDQLILQDIHALSDSAGLPDKDTLLKVLHMKRGDAFLTGIDANLAAWEHTSWLPIWRLLKLPLIYSFTRWVYDVWARQRFSRLYGTSCQLDNNR
ncbi:putative thiol-disulphide oxidoreductase DCC [Luminiphilus syltensis NOR5-1B]|uniref:Putative thiol-disulphide oxidoreductase DCC n=1 Tax=Luminiphilus syltensis NOR5-1B TaxID=565045 RepID=B8KSE7_9GAMM|nr:DUF393 domain-containing protein [Luminiphilus syltensis]EED34793.1 putative thiol-disulphide oxidoreductase DCC [Luminiphilus syltensis NOR5-1B]